jgi:hypothetical protein
MQKYRLPFYRGTLFEASNIEMQLSGAAPPMTPITAVC